MPQTANAIIINDINNSAKALGLLLSKLPEINNVESYNDPIAGLDELKNGNYDLLFLDLDMPKMKGVEFLRLLYSSKIHIHIIIVTSSEKMIVEASRYPTLGFLLNPFTIEDVYEILKKYHLHVELHLNNESRSVFTNFRKQKIKIPTSFEELFFFPDEISYLEADGNYTNIATKSGEIIISSFNLGRIQELLPRDLFFRISRKVIINFTYLQKIDKRKKVCVLNHEVKKAELSYSKPIIARSGLLD